MSIRAAVATRSHRGEFLSEQMGQRELALTIGALLLCVFLGGLDASIVANALPRIVTDLKGFELYAWVTTSYLLSSTAVVPVVGKLGDRYGRKPWLVGGAGYFLVTTGLCGLAQDMLQLIVFRTLQGVGGGVLMASAFAALGQLLSPAVRARISWLITLSFGLSTVVGPLIGGFLTDFISWRAVFYVNLPFGALALLVLWREFPGVRYSASRLPVDIWGAVTIMAATVALLLVLSWGGHEYAWDSPFILTLLGAGLALLVAFVLIEARAPDPIVPLGLFRNSVVSIITFDALVQAMGTFAVALFIPLFAQGVIGTTATVSGAIMLPMMVSMVLTNLLVGQLIARSGQYRAFAVIGLAVDTAGLVLLATMGADAPYALLAVLMAIMGVGNGCIVPTLSLVAQSAVPFRQIGVSTSLLQFSRSMGNTLGSAVFGTVLVARFLPEVQSAVPPSVAIWLQGPGRAALQDPQALLNPGAADALRVSLDSAFPNAGGTVDVVFSAIRTGLAGSLHWVFLGSAGLMAAGTLVTLFMQDLRIRERVQAGTARSESGGTNPTAEGALEV